MTPEELLTEAANYLEEYGWRQHSSGFNSGPRCVNGAFITVCDRLNLFHPTNHNDYFELKTTACNRLRRVIGYADAETNIVRACGVVVVSDILHWNDTAGRTAQEVVDALREAAV